MPCEIPFNGHASDREQHPEAYRVYGEWMSRFRRVVHCQSCKRLMHAVANPASGVLQCDRCNDVLDVGFKKQCGWEPAMHGGFLHVPEKPGPGG